MRRGTRILRSAPWLALLTALGVESALLSLGVMTRGRGDSVGFVLLAMAVCGGTAGYVLDEEATSVADATPSSRPWRAAWRISISFLPVAVAVAGLAALHGVNPSTDWLRLTPFACGVAGCGAALAAAMRRADLAAPGDLAGVVTIVVTLVLVAVNPLRHWVSVAPLGPTDHLGRTVVMWGGVLVACAVVTALSVRDPGRPAGPRKQTG
jgi:hypothetical protein